LFTEHNRAAVGYGSYDPYNIGGMFNRRSGGWRSNSRFNGGWNQYGELLNCIVCCIYFTFTNNSNTVENLIIYKTGETLSELISKVYNAEFIDVSKCSCHTITTAMLD
jgi:hypothetical protein